MKIHSSSANIIKPVFSNTILVALLLALATSPIVHAETSNSGDSGLSESTQAGIGCLVGSAFGMGMSLWAGPSEVIMIAAGGLLVPSATAPLLASLTATVVAASCGIGVSLTPVTLWVAEQVGVIAPKTEPTADVGSTVTVARQGPLLGLIPTTAKALSHDAGAINLPQYK
ncbi:hypothetical protein TI04_02330 [Achromatium sp. WMS2]|nr:hypothetical protein TI04_02330 [Achromatium sp. WMS2]